MTASPPILLPLVTEVAACAPLLAGVHRRGAGLPTGSVAGDPPRGDRGQARAFDGRRRRALSSGVRGHRNITNTMIYIEVSNKARDAAAETSRGWGRKLRNRA
jgi:hypothetical protein